MATPVFNPAPMFNPNDPYMQGLRQRFDSVDLDKSGSIEYQEIHKLFNNPADPIDYNIAKMIVSLFSQTGSISFQQFIECDRFLRSIDAQFIQADRNKDGRIQFNELLGIVQPYFPYFQQQQLQAVFRRFSKDPSRAFLTYAEFLSVMVFINLISQRFCAWDTQRTGKITLDMNSFMMCLLWFV